MGRSFKVETGLPDNQILAVVEPKISLTVMVSNGIGVSKNGKTVVKAGTPLHGDLTNRTTPFVAHADSSADAVGVLLHDVDVTDGDAEGALLIFGVVNMARLESDVAEKITANVKKALNAKVTFIK